MERTREDEISDYQRRRDARNRHPVEVERRQASRRTRVLAIPGVVVADLERA